MAIIEKYSKKIFTLNYLMKICTYYLKNVHLKKKHKYIGRYYLNLPII